MPAAVEYNANDKALRAAADAEFQQRQDVIKRNADYYYGRHKKWLKDDTSNVVINLCRQAIDRIISFLVPKMPALELNEEETTDDEQLLMTVWNENGGATLLNNMVWGGCVAGQVYARVFQDTDGNIKIVNLNPANVITFWDSDDYNKVLWYELRWNDAARQDVVWDGNRWLILQYERGEKGWRKVDEIIWPYVFSPIVDWQHQKITGQYYGQHELQHAALNDIVNKIASDVAEIIRYHATPRTIGTGIQAGQVQETGIDRFWAIDDADAKVFNLEMSSDLSSSMNYLALLREMFLAESRVSIVPSSLDAFRNMTNLGIRAAFMDMSLKNESLRRAYGWGIQEISKRVLALAGLEPVAPRIVWDDALPVDGRETLQVVQQEMGLGLLSKRTASAILGLNYDTESERLSKEYMEDDILNGFGDGAAT